MEREFNVYDVIEAEYNLEPLTCLFCHSQEVVFLQYVGDAICQDCGMWQLEESEETIQIEENNNCHFCDSLAGECRDENGNSLGHCPNCREDK